MARHGWSATFIGLALVGLGCGGAVSSKESGPPPDVLFLEATGTTFSSPFAANLKGTFGSVALRDFGFSASNGAGWVYFNGRLAAEDLSAGTAALTVSSSPIANGIANAQVVGVNGVPDLDGTVAELHFSPGAVAGTLTPRGAGAPWTLTSELSVECWVPKADLPAPQQPAGGTDAAGALVADETFTAPQCASLRALAGR